MANLNSKSTLDYLSTLGNKDKGDEMPASAKALVELAAMLIEKASDNMDRKENVATGGTISSMKIVNADLSGTNMSVEVEILKTYKFLDLGVKGVGGVGRGKFQFKTKYVSKKMALAILKWLRRRGATARTYPALYGSYGTRLKTGGKGKIERKDLRIKKQVDNAASFKSLAYAVSSSIKQNGIKPTFFFTNAVKDTQKESRRKFAEAFKVDIINSLS